MPLLGTHGMRKSKEKRREFIFLQEGMVIGVNRGRMAEVSHVCVTTPDVPSKKDGQDS